MVLQQFLQVAGRHSIRGRCDQGRPAKSSTAGPQAARVSWMFGNTWKHHGLLSKVDHRLYLLVIAGCLTSQPSEYIVAGSNMTQEALMSEKIEAGLVINIINMQSKIQKRIGATLSTHGIGLSEYLVLNQLYIATNQKMRRIDLAEQVGLSPSGVTRLLNPMEKIGLVEKEDNPRDARVSMVTLSKAGKKVFEEAKISFEHASITLFESLDKKRLNAFSELLEFVAK